MLVLAQFAISHTSEYLSPCRKASALTGPLKASDLDGPDGEMLRSHSDRPRRAARDCSHLNEGSDTPSAPFRDWLLWDVTIEARLREPVMRLPLTCTRDALCLTKSSGSSDRAPVVVQLQKWAHHLQQRPHQRYWYFLTCTIPCVAATEALRISRLVVKEWMAFSGRQVDYLRRLQWSEDVR